MSSKHSALQQPPRTFLSSAPAAYFLGRALRQLDYLLLARHSWDLIQHRLHSDIDNLFVRDAGITSALEEPPPRTNILQYVGAENNRRLFPSNTIRVRINLTRRNPLTSIARPTQEGQRVLLKTTLAQIIGLATHYRMRERGAWYMRV